MAKKEQTKSLKKLTEDMRKWAKENGIKIIEAKGDGKAYAVFKPKPKKDEKK